MFPSSEIIRAKLACQYLSMMCGDILKGYQEFNYFIQVALFDAQAGADF